MKKQWILFFALTVFSSILSAQISLVLDYKSFNIPSENPYLEFYLSINGNSISYAEVDSGKFQGHLEITYILSDESDSIVGFKKFQMFSPYYKETSEFLDLIDLKRLFIPNGNYMFEYIVKDLKSGKETLNKVPLKEINYSESELEFSDILLCNSISQEKDASPIVKNELSIEPNFGFFFNKQHDNLGFYIELYNSNIKLGKNEAFLFEYSIKNKSTNKVFNNLKDYQRLNSNVVIPIAKSIDITNLPSGNYSLELTCKNKLNEVLISQEYTFQRSNPNLRDLKIIDVSSSFASEITEIELLKEYINSMAPISSSEEYQFAQNQMAYADLTLMQKYFLNFWNNRNELNPEGEWLKYKREVEIADQEFGYGGVKGYQTERGRVYLHYGKPNAVQKVPYETNTYPYSVWQYYKLKGQTNRRIIFYSPSMEMLGYEVLHSNIQGEIQNPNWEIELQSKVDGRAVTKENPYNSTINDRAKDLFNNPR